MLAYVHEVVDLFRTGLEGLVEPGRACLAVLLAGWLFFSLGRFLLRKAGGKGLRAFVFVAVSVALTVPVLLLVKHWGYPNALQWNPTWGASLPHFVDKIQQTIDSWEGVGNYQLDVIDLSGFKKLNE